MNVDVFLPVCPSPAEDPIESNFCLDIDEPFPDTDPQCNCFTEIWGVEHDSMLKPAWPKRMFLNPYLTSFSYPLSVPRRGFRYLRCPASPLEPLDRPRL